MPDVTPHHGELAGEPVFWLDAAGEGDVPVLYVHGVPTSADDWVPFLERIGGIAPDLPGFGRSGKRGDGDYTMHRYAPWLQTFLADRGIDRFKLVVHDWGAVGLILAQLDPARVERLVIMNALPLLPGYRWHRVARAWRRPVVGELLMGAINRFTIGVITRESNVKKGKLPQPWIDAVAEQFDLGTQRAILRLYRSGDPEALVAAGAGLGTIACPTLVLWGDGDPYITPGFADDYGAAIPGAEVVHLPDAGHWPWLDRPDVVDTVAAFLAG
ncbi:Haloalkane dehalogenase [Paraconexibacter sp. AEG42_29]|uniref:Haloalkane dehalogenase n=1 Tax=Paraconexibacter sp. AEG42_29 TaxID=2997339 RepID=A0AAU7AP99_9ACTN